MTATTTLHIPAAQAALDELETSVAASSNPSWRHEFDLVDLASAPVNDLQALLAAAPTTLAATFMTAAICLRT